MRLLLVTAMVVAELTSSVPTWAQIIPVSVQMHGEGHAAYTPPFGPPQSQNASNDLTVLGEVVTFAPIGDFNFGPFSSGSGAAAVKLFGGGYRFASIAAASGRPAGSTTTANGAADASFVFNIDQACTMQLAMQFVINPPSTLVGGASTFFEFYGPGDSLIYSMHLNQPTQTIHVNQSFDLLPGQYRMMTQSLANFQSQGSSTILNGWSCQSVVDFTVPAPGCLAMMGGLLLQPRRHRH